MEKRFSGLVCLLFLIIAVEFVMYSEAVAECKSKSREYKGKRCTRSNCSIICKQERFNYGLCQRTKRLGTKCYCIKPCSAGGGGGTVNPPPSNEDGGDTPPSGGGDEPPPSGGNDDAPPSGGSDDPPPSDNTPSTGPRECKARSREYKGRRCTRRNCSIICKHERFEFGQCLKIVGLIKPKCYCYKTCPDALAGYSQ